MKVPLKRLRAGLGVVARAVRHHPAGRSAVASVGRVRRAASVEAQGIVARLSPPVRDEIGRRVRDLLATRAALFEAAQAEADALQRSLQQVEPRVAREIARLDRAPFGPGTTVHAAHARHPGVQAVFARYGLPRCPDCAVGADETLAEAAFGESLPLDALLAELNALLDG